MLPQLPYPFICWWASRLLPCPGYNKQCCDEHWGARVSFRSGFLGVCAQKWDCWVIWKDAQHHSLSEKQKGISEGRGCQQKLLSSPKVGSLSTWQWATRTDWLLCGTSICPHLSSEETETQKRLHNLFKVTQLSRSRAGIPPQESWLQIWLSNTQMPLAWLTYFLMDHVVTSCKRRGGIVKEKRMHVGSCLSVFSRSRSSDTLRAQSSHRCRIFCLLVWFFF